MRRLLHLAAVALTTASQWPAQTLLQTEKRRLQELERSVEAKIRRIRSVRHATLREAVHASSAEIRRLRRLSSDELERWLASLSDTPHAFGPSAWLLGEARARLREVEDAGGQQGPLPGWLLRSAQNRRQWWHARRLSGSRAVQDLSGTWKMQERHDMVEFLTSMGFNALQRAAVLRAGQVQVLRRVGDSLHIVTRDILGTRELVLPIGGPPVEGEGDDPLRPVSRCAYEDGERAVVITETVRGETTPSAICRRSLQPDGRLCVDVKKRAPTGEMVSMRIIFTPVHEGRGGRRVGRGAAEAKAAGGAMGGACEAAEEQARAPKRRGPGWLVNRLVSLLAARRVRPVDSRGL
jgi:hypothetical protein